MCEEEEPAPPKLAPAEEPISGPNAQYFFKGICDMINRGTPKGAPPVIALSWEEYRDFAPALAPATQTVSTELAPPSTK